MSRSSTDASSPTGLHRGSQPGGPPSGQPLPRLGATPRGGPLPVRQGRGRGAPLARRAPRQGPGGKGQKGRVTVLHLTMTEAGHPCNRP
jgi:hypothetical protein